MIGCFFTVAVRQNAASTEMEYDLVALLAVDEVKVGTFGKTSDGETVHSFFMKNAKGLRLTMMDYGATVVSLEVPDKQGNLKNIVLTCPNIDGFQKCTMYFNGTVGRYCNRIAKGKFKLGDHEYSLATNNGPNHLHGGVRGFDKRIWKAEPFSGKTERGVKFSLTSQDGDEGYPGKLDVSVIYTLTDNNEFVVEYHATTDKATPVNLTNHNYWNLSGEGNILDHELQLAATKFLPVDDTAIPTGKLVETEGTPFDFSRPHAIGSRFKELTGEPVGYDHCFVVDGTAGDMRLAAKVKDPKSGRTLEIRTTEPGIQFYSGNFLDGKETSGGYAQYSAFCLETQHYPDSPNQPNFPTTVLEPGGKYYHKTVHILGVD